MRNADSLVFDLLMLDTDVTVSSSSPANEPTSQIEAPRPSSPIRLNSQQQQPSREPGEGRAEKFKELLFDINTNLGKVTLL